MSTKTKSFVVIFRVDVHEDSTSAQGDLGWIRDAIDELLLKTAGEGIHHFEAIPMTEVAE